MAEPPPVPVSNRHAAAPETAPPSPKPAGKAAFPGSPGGTESPAHRAPPAATAPVPPASARGKHGKAAGARLAPAAPHAAEALPAQPPAVPKDPQRLSARDASHATPPVLDARTKAMAAALREKFERLPDGRWSYRAALGGCSLAEGLAATLKAPQGSQTRGLGDCLLCSNWNKRLGCAIACSYDLEARQGHQGLQLLQEEVVAWTGARRFDIAIARLDDYVKSNPEDAAGFRELARVYDRPDYNGRDRRRAIVLYGRFVELARRPGASFPNVEITRAENRATALLTSPAETGSGLLGPGMGVAFQCFYRGSVTCFACGMLTAERLVVARAGDVDPDSGVSAQDVGGSLVRATAIFRHFKSERTLKDEQARTKTELARLSRLGMDALVKDAACVATVDCSDVTNVALSSATCQVALRSVTMQAQQAHQLLFTEAAAFKAEQCHELLRRKLAKT
ncbi:MAG: hypothetical protein NTW87_29545 [Planctomycetota bacterium]|nr:hypothetical protein [Planctomycetota bacterium]